MRPTLLNSQDWLRFWVEEHLVMPTAAGSGKQQPRSRRTLSFNSSRGPSSTHLLSPGSDETPAVAAAALASGGRAGGQAAAAMAAAGAGSAAQVKAIRFVSAESILYS